MQKKPIETGEIVLQKALKIKEEFIKVYTETIKRAGSKELLEYLVKSDFFTAPASTNGHCSKIGGLAEHSLNVYYRLKKLIKNEYKKESPYSEETIALCGLLHDVCKINYYKVEERNVKEDGKWVQRPFYSVDDQLPYGHGEKSVYIINGFLRLTREEALAINWHMGGFDARNLGNPYSMGESFKRYPLCLWTHLADMGATYFDENTALQQAMKEKREAEEQNEIKTNESNKDGE